MDRRAQRIEWIEKSTQAKGKAFLLKQLRGGTLTRQQAIEAFCYECSCLDGPADCENEMCPLYAFFAYAGNGIGSNADAVMASSDAHSV